MDKTGRNGIRVEISSWKTLKNVTELLLTSMKQWSFDEYSIQQELEKKFFESIEDLKKLDFIDSEEYLHQAQKQVIYFERCSRVIIRRRFGTYPFVTSSNTTAAGACTGLGIAQTKLKRCTEFLKRMLPEVDHSLQNFWWRWCNYGSVGNEFLSYRKTKTLWMVGRR
jgi:adenylosuccinate synthase